MFDRREDSGRVAGRIDHSNMEDEGDVHDLGKSRGITLVSQVLKLLERVLDGRIRKNIECEIGEEQQEFRKGRGTTDGLFTLRQVVEKKLKKSKGAFDTDFSGNSWHCISCLTYRTTPPPPFVSLLTLNNS